MMAVTLPVVGNIPLTNIVMMEVLFVLEESIQVINTVVMAVTLPVVGNIPLTNIVVTEVLFVLEVGTEIS